MGSCTLHNQDAYGAFLAPLGGRRAIYWHGDLVLVQCDHTLQTLCEPPWEHLSRCHDCGHLRRLNEGHHTPTFQIESIRQSSVPGSSQDA